MNDLLKQAADALPEPFSRFQHEAGRPLYSADQMRDYALAALAALASKQAPIYKDQATWCGYIAGMIGAYLRWPIDDPRLDAVTGIIERRLCVLPSAQAKSEPADLQRIELSDGAWLERGGPLSIWGLYRANTGHLRELNRFEREFIDCTIRAAAEIGRAMP